MAGAWQREELEYKLAVGGPDPAATLEAIAAREALGDFRLRRAASHAIHDRYWDTPDDSLRAAGATLRLRVQDASARFTLKSDRSATAGLFARDELEPPATPDGWNAVLAELARLGVSLDPRYDPDAPPHAWLQGVGLRVIQDRATRRVVLLASRERDQVAELSLDTTTYHLPGGDHVFHEVEIEAVPGLGTADDLRELAGALQAAFPGRLEPSEVGKLRRGLDLAAAGGIVRHHPEG